MSSQSKTIVLITGANRGLGRGLASIYLSRPDHTVIATVRDPAHPSAKSLSTLFRPASTQLIIVKIDSANESDAANAISTLIDPASHNIQHLNLVIANAGISTAYPTVADAKPADLRTHHNINVIGPLTLFQATLPLLKKAASTSEKPKFVAISSGAGSLAGIGAGVPPNAAYGPSKTALNYLMRKMHFENEELVAFPVDPGWVQTDMGNSAAKGFGLEKAETSIEDSVNGIAKVIDGATRESLGGKFALYSGGEKAW